MIHVEDHAAHCRMAKEIIIIMPRFRIVKLVFFYEIRFKFDLLFPIGLVAVFVKIDP